MRECTNTQIQSTQPQPINQNLNQQPRHEHEKEGRGEREKRKQDINIDKSVKKHKHSLEDIEVESPNKHSGTGHRKISEDDRTHIENKSIPTRNTQRETSPQAQPIPETRQPTDEELQKQADALLEMLRVRKETERARLAAEEAQKGSTKSGTTCIDAAVAPAGSIVITDTSTSNITSETSDTCS